MAKSNSPRPIAGGQVDAEWNQLEFLRKTLLIRDEQHALTARRIVVGLLVGTEIQVKTVAFSEDQKTLLVDLKAQTPEKARPHHSHLRELRAKLKILYGDDVIVNLWFTGPTPIT